MRLRRSLPALTPSQIALLALALSAATLRLWFMLSYRPGFVGYPDARAYIIAADGPLYWNPYKPVGYPLFLEALRGIDGRLSVTIAIQHLLGLATAVLLYLATAPFVRRRWTALLPAVVVLFGGSQVFLEHAVLSDAPYTFVLVVALYCALRGMRSDERSLWWLAAAGAALAASATLRTVGAFLLPLLATWILLPREQPWRARLAGAGTMLGTAGLLLIVYLIPQHAETGSWGLTRTAGFTFYARMAPLADCTRFTPPPGTARLCQRSEPSTRANANRYIFSAQAPAVRLYGAPPYPRTPVEQGAYRYGGDEPTRRFAKAVLVHQPLDYLASVAEGLGNFVVPRAGRPSVFEYDQDELVTQLHDPRFEGDAAADITSFYSTRAGYLRRNVDALDSYGRTVKLEGALTAVLALLALAGGILGRAGARHAAALFGASAFSLALLPVAILFYDVRYAAPVVALLAAAAAIGTDRCCDLLGPRARRLREQIGRRPASAVLLAVLGAGALARLPDRAGPSTPNGTTPWRPANQHPRDPTLSQLLLGGRYACGVMSEAQSPATFPGCCATCWSRSWCSSVF